MGFKESLLKLAGPEGWIAAKFLEAKEKVKRAPKVAVGAAVAGGAAAYAGARAMSSPAPNVPVYHGPSGERVYPFAQAGLFIILGFIGWFLAGRFGYPQYGVWAVVFGFLAALARLWPTQGFIAMFGVITYVVLHVMGLLTSWAAGLTIALTALLVGYTKAPEKFERFFHFIFLVLGGIGIFLLTAWFQDALGWAWRNIFTAVILLVYWMWILFRKAPASEKLIVIFVNLLFFAPLMTNVYQGFLYEKGGPIDNAVESQRQAWSDMYGGVKTFGKETVEGIRTQMLIATGEYEEGVEANSERPLGVYLENIQSDSEVFEDGRIDVSARVRAEAFKTDKPLKIKVKCYEEGHEKDVPENKQFQGEVRLAGEALSTNEFVIEEGGQQDIDCIFDDPNALGTGPHTIVIDTAFTFTTGSFLKAYFMEQDRIRAYRKENKDPLDVFGITDKNPSAVFTGGPLKIGMGVGQQPIGLVVKDDVFGPTLGITIDRNWFEGELVDVSKIEITVPPGLIVVQDTKLPMSCSGGGDKEQVCVLDKLDVLFPKPIVMPKTIRMFTKLDAKNNAAILAGAPLAIRSFKVDIDYTYRMKKSVNVVVKERKVQP